MKLSRSSIRTLVAVLTLLFVLAGPPAAVASLSDDASGTSTTNPNSGDSAWRMGWGNTLQPQFTLTSVPADGDTQTVGFRYNFSRNTASAVPTEAYQQGISWDTAGVMQGNTFDLYGMELDKNPSIQQEDLEGLWYVNMRFYNASRIATDPVWDVTRFRFGIDITRPAPVEGFTSGVTMPTHSSRRTFTWIHKDYDTLSPRANSGAFWYHIYLNGKEITGKPLGPPFRFDNFPLQWLPIPAITLEDLPPGINKVSIQVEDRATNKSDVVERTEIVDRDYPSLGVGYPWPGALVSGTRTFTATATDDACDPTVTFKVDGVARLKGATPPYVYTIDTKKLSAGKHTLVVEATDLFGHSRTVTRDFYVDNIAMGISSLSDSPDPFYPIRQDGYKDSVEVKARLGERASDVFLQIYDGVNIVRQVQLSDVPAGDVKLRWDGKDNSGVVPVLTDRQGYKIYQYRIVSRDYAGNWSFSAIGQTEIRNFEIVPWGNGAVKVIER